MAGCFEHVSKPYSSVRAEKCAYQLSDCKLLNNLKAFYDPWSYILKISKVRRSHQKFAWEQTLLLTG